MSAEVPVISVQAVVLYYNNQSKQWVQTGHGQSIVELYRHTTAGTYRVVARLQTDQSVVINSALYLNLEYRRATETFHQWQDMRYVYGLNFSSREDANLFGHAMETAVRAINAAAGGPPPMPTSTPVSAPETSTSTAAMKAENRKSAAPTAALPSIPGVAPPSQPPPSQPPKTTMNPGFKTLPHKANTPAVPPPPPVPTMDTPPPAPITPSPAMPAPTGNIPAPPPPPAPVSSSGGGSLAEQLAAAKLKKREPVEDTGGADRPVPVSNTSGSRNISSGGPTDMMGEMASKLAAKRKAAEASAANPPQTAPVAPPTSMTGDDQEDAPPPPPPGGPAIVDNKTAFSKPPLAAPQTTTTKSPPTTQKFSVVNGVPAVTAPPVTTKKPASQTALNISNDDLQALKTELLAEFRAELNQFKAEILAALQK